MKKIHFIVGNFNFFGGVERVTETLSFEFSNRKIDVKIHSLYSNYSDKNLSKANLIHYSLTPPDSKNGIWGKIKIFIQNGLKLKRLAHQIDSVTIFQGFYIASYLPFLSSLNNKTIICEHSTYAALGRLSKIYRLFLYRIYQPIVVVLSDADREYFKHWGINQVFKVLNPSPFKIQNESMVKLNRTLISLGRFSNEKRFDLLIKICSQILPQFPDWNLLLQGSGPELSLMEKVRSNCSCPEQIEILPSGDPIGLYQKAAVFLMTSKYEGQPMTLIESMSCGIPSVIFNCSPGMKELVLDDLNGFLINQDDEEEFKAKLTQIMRDHERREEMGMKALQLAKRFSLDKTIENWLRILR